MNEISQTSEIKIEQQLGAEYVHALRTLESEDSTIEDVTEAGYTLAEILTRIALYGRAMTANLDLVLNCTAEAQDPEPFRQTRLQLGAVLGEEADFCLNMERLNRDKLLKAAGVDASDPVAVAEFFRKAASCLVFAAPSGDN